MAVEKARPKRNPQLWDRGRRIDRRIENFTAGKDPQLDLQLVPYDAAASIAHAEMLERLGIINAREEAALKRELERVIDLHRQGRFRIDVREEDCHTAIENYLTRRLGDAGKKIHTFRSRNDQVLTALRLCYKEQLADCRDRARGVIAALQSFARRHGEIPLPGFTHTRKAMPSSVALWAGAFSESLQDNLQILRAAWDLIDQSPLGSGAGYGIPYPIDRAGVARRLGFARVQKNPVYVQNSRGKWEVHLLHVLSLFLFDINKMATDLIFFTMPELGFFELPDSFLTGSSIMPHKRNPDVLELLRAQFHLLLSRENEIRTLTANLISGYHRDFQQTKEPVLAGFAIARESLKIAALVVKNLKVNPARCRLAMCRDLHSVDQVYQLVAKNIPFRDAYRLVAAKSAKNPS